MNTRLGLATIIAAFAVSSASMAADRRVDIVNNTGQVMTKFYASNQGTNSWEEDILGRDTLADGETVNVDINDGSGACVFDFKAVFQSGATSEKRGVNVCQISTFTYTP